jgi:hypothetical protein
MLAVDTPILMPILDRSLLRCRCAIAGVFGVREIDASLRSCNDDE